MRRDSNFRSAEVEGSIPFRSTFISPRQLFANETIGDAVSTSVFSFSRLKPGQVEHHFTPFLRRCGMRWPSAPRR